MRRGGLLLLTAVAFFLGGLVTYSYMTGHLFRRSNAVSTLGPLKLNVDNTPIKDPGAIAAAAARVEPSVVTIDTTTRRTFVQQDAFGFFSQPFQREVPLGTGSGVIISPNGIIVTNNHVIQDASHIKVTLQDGRQLSGRVVGADSEADLAVVKVDADNLPAATLGSSDNLRVGEWVVAVGDPLRVGTTVTQGIVSAIRKSGPEASGELASAIQTDAPINPGNSGGALADIQGRVIGINTAIATPNGGNVGIGFAIPIDVVKKAVPELIANGVIQHAWMGIQFGPLSDSDRQQLSIPPAVQGLIIVDVMQGGPAANAGVQPGDVVRSVDGQPASDDRVLQRAIQNKKPGENIVLDIWRGGSDQQVTVTLGQRPSNEQLQQEMPGQQMPGPGMPGGP